MDPTAVDSTAVGIHPIPCPMRVCSIVLPSGEGDSEKCGTA